MTGALWQKLEAFQAKLLWWSKHHSNTVAPLVIEVPTIRSSLDSNVEFPPQSFEEWIFVA